MKTPAYNYVGRHTRERNDIDGTYKKYIQDKETIVEGKTEYDLVYMLMAST